MINKITVKSKNRRFQHPRLIFYCYLLMPLNELARNALNINTLKIRKKIIDISMVSIGFAGKGIFNYELRITNYDGHTPGLPTFVYAPPRRVSHRPECRPAFQSNMFSSAQIPAPTLKLWRKSPAPVKKGGILARFFGDM